MNVSNNCTKMHKIELLSIINRLCRNYLVRMWQKTRSFVCLKKV